MKRKIIAISLAIFMIIGLIPINSLQAQGDTSGYSGRASQTDEKLWPNNGNELQVFKQVSAGWTDDDARFTSMQYVGTLNNGKEIDIDIVHSGKTYATNNLYNFDYGNFIQDGQGWSYVAMRFEEDLYNAIDFEKSYVYGNAGTFFLGKASETTGEIGRIINGVDRVKAFAYEDVFGVIDKFRRTNTAHLKLVLKDGAKLEPGRQYRMEHRVLRKTKDTNQILIREWATGVDGRKDQFANSRHNYSQSTYVTPIPYGVKVEDDAYLSGNESQANVIFGSMMDMEVDWEAGLLTVRYYFDTDTMNSDRNQFVELMPIQLRECLVPDAYGAVAYHTYLNRFGRKNTTSNSAGARENPSTPITMNEITWNEEKGLGGIRFTRPNTHSTGGPKYSWINRWDYDWNKRPYYFKTSLSPVQNVIQYRIDPYKLLETFGGKLEDLKFRAFFIGPIEGKLIPRSDNNVNGIVFPRTEVNPTVDEPIFTDSEEFTGKTNLNKERHAIQVTVTDTKGNAAEVLSNRDSGKFTFNKNTTNEARLNKMRADLKKGDVLTFKNMDLTAAYGASSGTKVTVKARVRFRDNEEKTGRDNVKFYDSLYFDNNGEEKSFILADDQNTLGSLPTAPEKKGFELVGWTKKPVANLDEFKQLEKTEKKITKASQWDDDENYIFKADSPLDKSQIVYAVWKKAQDGIKIILHDNKGLANEETKTLVFEEATRLPDHKVLTGKDCKEFDQQVNYALGENPDSLLPNAYTFDDTINNKDVESIFTEKVVGDRHYTLVGWSTKADNGNELVESLFNNRAILSTEKVGDTIKYYLTQVATNAYDADGHLLVGQASAARKTVEIKPDENGEVHLYAAWKPYYNVTVEKKWYDGTSSGKSVRDNFELIAHNKDGRLPEQKPAGDISVGLIRRTAVTEANSPTVTPIANYYNVPGSLKRLNKTDTQTLTWQVPGFDNYGKRYSYVAIEFNPDEAETSYNGFAQRWANVWTEVEDNVEDKLGDGSNFTDKTITKIQSLTVKNGNNVDAYSGATIRKLEGDSMSLDSKVEAQGTYAIQLFNIKVNIEAPALLDVFGGEHHFYFKQYDTNKNIVLKLKLPEVSDPIYMMLDKQSNTWKRVYLQGNYYKPLTNPTDTVINITESTELGTEKDESGKDIIDPNTGKPKLVKVWKLEYLNPQGKADPNYVFRSGQRITALYTEYIGNNTKTNHNSETASKIVRDKPEAPTLRNLVQIRKADGFVRISASAPISDLGQFSYGAKIYLADPETGKRITKEGTLEKAGETYTDDNFILAEKAGDKYLFKIPEAAAQQIVKDERAVTALNTDVNKKDALTKVPVKLDLTAPVITKEDKTVYLDEDFKLEKVVTTDEDADVQFEGLPKWARVERPSSEINLYQDWTVLGKALGDDKIGNHKLTLKAEDRYGNASQGEWNLFVKKRDTSNAGFEAKQAKNDPKTNILVSKAVKDATIKVYLEDPAKNKEASPIAISGVMGDPTKIYIDDQYIPRIKSNESNVYLVQEEEGKLPSTTKELLLDVTPPAVPTPSAEPRSNIVHLTQPAVDVQEMTIEVEGTKKTIYKNDRQQWVDERSNMVTDNGINGLDVDFGQKKFSPDVEIIVTAGDQFANEARAKGNVGSAEAPYVEIHATAYNGKDDVITTVKGNAEGAHQVYVYKANKVTDSEGKVTYEKVGKPIGRADVDEHDEFIATLSPQLTAGTDLLLAPVRYEVEGEPTHVVVAEDKNGNGVDDALEAFNPGAVKSMEVTNPTKTEYPIVKDTDKANLDLKGMEVTLVDELGKKAVIAYGEDGKPTVKSVDGPTAGDNIDDKTAAAKNDLTAKLKDLTTNPANGTELKPEANDKKPIEVTYKVKEGEEVKGQTDPIRVFNDKNNNGIPDNEEDFDWNNLDPKGTKVDNWPRMEYKDGEKMDLSGLLVTLKDTTGKVKTLAYGKDAKGAMKDDFKAEDVAVAPAHDLKLSAENAPEGHNNANIVLTLNKTSDKKTITLDEKELKVIYDSDGNGVDDREETTKLEDVKALNRGDMPNRTVVTGKTECKSIKRKNNCTGCRCKGCFKK